MSQLIASETPDRVAAFALAVHPLLLTRDPGPVGPDGINDLSRCFVQAGHVDAKLKWLDRARKPMYPPSLYNGESPAYIQAVATFEAWPEPRHTLAAQLLACACALAKKVPDTWPALLEEFEQRLEAVSPTRKTPSGKRHGTAAV